MELPSKSEVPLPALVDDWVDGQCRSRSVSFAVVAQEALAFLRLSMADVVDLEPNSDGAPTLSLAEEADRLGVAGVADLLTQAICTFCGEQTGAGLSMMMDSGWRRLPEDQNRQRWTPLEQAPSDLENGRRTAAEARVRGDIIGAAWREAGRPEDPRKKWRSALARVTIPDDELFNVYVLPDLVAQDLSDADARELMGRLRRSREFADRLPDAFLIWPTCLEPLPEDWKEREAAAISWYRSLGVAAPHPDEDSPERRLWEAWLKERDRLREDVGGSGAGGRIRPLGGGGR